MIAARSAISSTSKGDAQTLDSFSMRSIRLLPFRPFPLLLAAGFSGIYLGTASASAEERAPRAFDAVFLESPEWTRPFSHLEIPSLDSDDRVWSPRWGRMHTSIR
jgi:hypothetical protein